MKKSVFFIILSLFTISLFTVPAMAQLPDPNALKKQAEEAKQKAEEEKRKAEEAQREAEEAKRLAEEQAAAAAAQAAAARDAMFTRVIYMDFNSTAVSGNSRDTLDEILNGLDDLKMKIDTAPPGTVLLITGHADAVGDEAYNQELSVRRANYIKGLILQKGVIEDSMIEAEGKGESEPEDANDDAKNRRVVLKLDYRG